MKIFKRIKSGKYKCYTIRQSKYGWFDLYSPGGISQIGQELTLEQIKDIINEQQRPDR